LEKWSVGVVEKWSDEFWENGRMEKVRKIGNQ